MTNNLYIKIKNGAPDGHPMILENVIQDLMFNHAIHYEGVTEEYILSHGFAKFQNLDLRVDQKVVGEPTGYKLDSDGIVRPIVPVADLTQDEKVELWIRRGRNFELQASDWTQLPDNGLSPEKRAEWAAYRQQLRELTTTFANIQSPEELVIPIKPN